MSAVIEGSPGERWVSFLRGYGPVNRIDGMYAETIQRLADAYGVAPLRFEHPLSSELSYALRPAEGELTNVVLTGTAGDGKTTLCNELWHHLSGDDSRTSGRDRSNHRSIEVQTPQGPRTLHFIFEFSGFVPEQGQAWPPERLDLLERFAASVLEADPHEFFIVAANDGKLVNALDSLPDTSGAKRLARPIENLLALGTAGADLRLRFFNLSQMSTREVVRRALDCLVARPEWSCFADEAEDPAFGPSSPLRKNYSLLAQGAVRERFEALAELCDANGFHVSIREVLLLLVNALLGHAKAADHLMRPDELRELALEGRASEATLYSNVFGANLPERRRDHFAVFRYFGSFRVGLETSNAHDTLIVFGPDDPDLQGDYQRLLPSDDAYGDNPAFEQLRVDYIEADEGRSDPEPFLLALVAERRRLFFRLSEQDERFDPWRLSVFQSAGEYRQKLLAPIAENRPVPTDMTATLVQGLNRVWTGMLAGELDRLYLTTGLDFTSARISDIFLYEVPLRKTPHGDQVSIEYDPVSRLPALKVAFGKTHGVGLPLRLIRFEFLTRVARGALPSSFSKECYEDIIAFKTQALAEYYRLTGGAPSELSILMPGPDGTFVPRQLSVAL